METLRLKPRQPVVDSVEDWDDDDFMIEEADDLTFRGTSSVSTNGAPPNRRDSHSSHMSLRSERESLAGEERQVHLPGDDETSTLDAIAAAASAGIPLPRNVPSSALMGGTIKRLGGRKIKKIIQEDWDDDLELPDLEQGLRIKPQDGTKFPEVLRQVSAQASPSKTMKLSPVLIQGQPRAMKSTPPPTGIDLDRFKDAEDDDDFFGDGAATIKVSKTRQPSKPISLITPPTPQKKEGEDDFEVDLELPSDGKLKLSNRKEIPKTPSSNTLDDLDWAEGSLGTRFGGTRRDARSNRSSSVSALSPSIASSITAESEDEALDGLVLPTGPVNFEERLKRRRQSRSPQRQEPQTEPPRLEPLERPQSSGPSSKQQTPQAEADREDFFSGLDVGDGAVFGSGKQSLHRNIVVKDTRTTSPSRPKTAVSLTFTNKPVTATSRLPRPLGAHHERTNTQSSLEPVSESGGPIPLRGSRRSQSRLGHSTQSSVSSIPTPSTPSSTQTVMPSTPRRREIGQKTSTVSLRNEPTTTSAQLLRLKRSLPAIRPPQSPARPPASRGYDRPPSRTDMTSRPQSAMRPKTPVERGRTALESAAAQARKNPVPFLPAGASATQSQNVNVKTSRLFRRHDSENSIDLRPISRAVSRSTMRSPSPSKRNRNAQKMAAEGAWHTFNKPRRMKQFGDGHELDGFDDLPTSAQAESRFMRQPLTSGPKVQQLRNKIYQNVLPDRTSTPSPLSPYSPAKVDYQPHFARDTAASRIAREASLAQRVPSSGPLAALTAQRVAQLSARTNLNPQLPQSAIRSKKSRKLPQKPQLISNLTQAKTPKTVNGMFYNPILERWEGNENALSIFDAPASSPSTASVPPPFMLREKENATPKPALITNIGSTKTVQVVGGMVFDPQNMCWLKRPKSNDKLDERDPMDGFNAIDDDSDDPFKDIPDLEDNTANSTESGGGRVSDIKDDWLVGEEFDVGPEFVRRQREEESRWRKKCEKWLGTGERDQFAWRMAIRGLVNDASGL